MGLIMDGFVPEKLASPDLEDACLNEEEVILTLYLKCKTQKPPPGG